MGSKLWTTSFEHAEDNRNATNKTIENPGIEATSCNVSTSLNPYNIHASKQHLPVTLPINTLRKMGLDTLFGTNLAHFGTQNSEDLQESTKRFSTFLNTGLIQCRSHHIQLKKNTSEPTDIKKSLLVRVTNTGSTLQVFKISDSFSVFDSIKTGWIMGSSECKFISQMQQK